MKLKKQAEYTFSLVDASVLLGILQYFIANSDTKINLNLQYETHRLLNKFFKYFTLPVFNMVFLFYKKKLLEKLCMAKRI